MSDGNRFKVVLQPFSDNFNDEYICEFTCTKCEEKVRSTPGVQARLAFGGTGHKCDNCGTYMALLYCPNCSNNLTIDDETWEQLAEPNGVKCPSCSSVLFRERKNWLPDMGSSGIICPSLMAWSDTSIEESYLSKLRLMYLDEKLRPLAIRHHSVGIRMKSAKDSLQYLIGNDWYSSISFSNTPGLIKEDVEHKTPFDHDFHTNVFGFINNLRSALDIISQEVAYIVKAEHPESKVDINQISLLLKKYNPELADYIDEYTKSDSFSYLNKLRNVLQHRRIPLMVTEGIYKTSELDTFRPKNIYSLALIKLPNDPYKFDEIENNNSYNVMLFPKIKELYDDTEKFMLDIYNKMIP